LTKTSAKSYYVVSEFFGNEIRAVALNIKAIDDVMKSVSGFMEENDQSLVIIKQIKEDIGKIQTGEQRIEEAKQKIANLGKDKENIKKELKQVESRISSVKKSKAFSEHKMNKKSIKEKSDELQSLEHEMVSGFSVLDKALRKYSKITLSEELVLKYLNNPIETLLGDKELKVIGVLQQLKAAVEKGDLELKDKKKTKTLDQIGKLTRERLMDFVKTHDKLKVEIAEKKSLVIKNKASLELKELTYKLEYLQTRLENADAKQKQLQEQLDKFDSDNILSEILKNIQHVFDVEVVIQN
jgi:DNA repair exonuclease SbcCD ATPase subunit